MSEFKAKRVFQRYVQRFQAPPEKVFPLLCPVREYDWIEPWSCELLYSNSGFAEKYCIFRTRFPGDTSDETWVVSAYEPPKRIEFVRVNALRVLCYSIVLTLEGDGATSATNERTLTALNPEGNEVLGALTDGTFVDEMRMGEAMLNHYLSTGSMLPLADALARVRGSK